MSVNRYLFSLLLLAFGFVGSAQAAKLSDLPSWAKAIVDSASQPVSVFDDKRPHDAAYLLDEAYIRFDPKTANQEHTLRTAVKILTSRGVQYAQNRSVGFNNQIRVVSITAWTVKPDGKVVVLKQTDIRDQASYPGFIFFSDSRVKLFNVPEAAPGDFIFYEIKLLETHPTWTTGLSGSWYVDLSEPVKLSRLTLELPPDWTFQTRSYNLSDKSPEVRGNGVYVWEWRDVKPFKEEKMTRADLGGGRLTYNITTPDPQWASRNRATWDDHASVYARLAWPRLTANPEIKATVTELTKSCRTDLEKIQAIANYLRNSLTYVAISVGVGGYQPHAAQEVFKNRYGDCKDMSALLVCMLREAGITAYPVLIRTIDEGAVDPDFPVPNFNHAIAFVPISDATVPWTTNWPETQPFGRGLWIDCTWKTCSIRDLPWTVQGAQALVVTPEKGYLIQTPVFTAEENQELRIGQVELVDSGEMIYEGSEALLGAQDMEWKSSLRDGTDQDRQDWIQRYIGDNIAQSNLEWFRHSSLTELDTPLRLDYRFTAPRYMNTAGNLAFFRPNILSPRTQTPFTDSTRTRPIFYHYPYAEIDSLTFVLPENYQMETLPPPVNLSASFGDYTVSYTLQGDMLTFVRKMRIAQREIPVERYGEVQKFYQTIVKTDKAQVVLKRRSTAQQP